MKKISNGIFLLDRKTLISGEEIDHLDKKTAAKGTMSYNIISSHNVSHSSRQLSLRFDALVAQDMTYIGVLQTAIACGLERFNLPFVMTDCHNSLCMMAGTFNEDDHIFSLSAAKKYGGIKVPAHQAIMHQYMREMFAGGGKMILGADSHTRYGSLGTIAIGEGAGELVKQLVGKTYDISYPEVVLVYLDGTPQPGVGPHDIALSIIGEVFADGFVKNRILEFCGPGIEKLPMDYRLGIDVMTTEASCLSSIWETDASVEAFLDIHGRKEDYKEIHPSRIAYYDRALIVNLTEIEPVIAMPFHPSNVFKIEDFNKNAKDIIHEVEATCNKQMEGFGLKLDLMSKLDRNGFKVDQGVVAGCAGGLFSNLSDMADILESQNIGNDAFGLYVYPASQPIMDRLLNTGIASTLIRSGAVLQSAFCGPCFGAGEIPGQNGFSIRHTTRNFANRDGSRPLKGQVSAVALMDARSIAATSVNKGYLIPATKLTDIQYKNRTYVFNKKIYESRCLNRYGQSDPSQGLILGPNIKLFPELPVFRNHLLVKVASCILDPVTTTDELIPGGESTSYRSNPMKLAEFALCTRDPMYVPNAKQIKKEADDMEKNGISSPELSAILERLSASHLNVHGLADITFGSVLVTRKPGDGSAREYAATCQRVLGGIANICNEYATKRYRSNLINWGVFPFVTKDVTDLVVGSYVFIPNLRKNIELNKSSLEAYLITNSEMKKIEMSLETLLAEEKEILLSGCLINYYRRIKEDLK